MAERDAFTAGVRPGGLTSSTEIRLLLCYLVQHSGPVTQRQLETALTDAQLVNYFEIGSCLDDIRRQGLVERTGDEYAITPKGRRVARELTHDLPLSVRERAVAAVVKAQLWTRKQAEYRAGISERADGHCPVRCMINRPDGRPFRLELGMPDRLTAELVKKQFILKGNEIYQLLINKLTEDEL